MGSERGCKHPDSGEMVVIDQPRIVIITVYKASVRFVSSCIKPSSTLGLLTARDSSVSNPYRFSEEKTIPDPDFRPAYKADGSIPTEAERSELNFR